MPWGAIFSAVAPSVIGGLMGKSGTDSAVGAQTASEQAKIDENRRQFDLTRSDNAPRIQSGNAALQKLSSLLGLSSPAPDREAIRRSLAPKYAPSASPSGGSSSGVSAWTNPDQSNYSQGGGLNMLQQFRANQPGGDPFATGTQSSSNELDAATEAEYQRQMQAASASSPDSGSLLKNFTGADVATEPGYQFGLNEGMKGLERSLAARGTPYGGAALKAASRYNSDYAGTKFNEAFNRDKANKSATFGMLSGVAGTGQTASNQVAQAGQFSTGQIGNALSSQGDARASGYLANSNTWQNALNQGISAYKNKNALGWSPNTISPSNAELYKSDDYGQFF
jgi:hypothetical protein